MYVHIATCTNVHTNTLHAYKHSHAHIYICTHKTPSFQAYYLYSYVDVVYFVSSVVLNKDFIYKFYNWLVNFYSPRDFWFLKEAEYIIPTGLDAIKAS